MFNGDCREAMEFYKSCFGGELKIMTHGESPMAAQAPAELRDKVMHSFLKSGKIEFMGADCMEACRHGNRVTLTLVWTARRKPNSSSRGYPPKARSDVPLRKSSLALTVS